MKKQIKKLTKKFHIDKQNKRIILDMNEVINLYDKIKVARVEEHPTFGQDRLEFSIIGEQ